MKLFKFTSIALLVALMVCAFTPDLSAKNHHRNHNCHKTVTKKYKSSGSFFGLSLNLNPTPSYVERVTYVQPQPVYYYPVYEPAPVYQAPVYQAPVYQAPTYQTPAYYEQVAVQRSSYSNYYSSPKVYVQPQFSYWNYW